MANQENRTQDQNPNTRKPQPPQQENQTRQQQENQGRQDMQDGSRKTKSAVDAPRQKGPQQKPDQDTSSRH